MHTRRILTASVIAGVVAGLATSPAIADELPPEPTDTDVIAPPAPGDSDEIAEPEPAPMPPAPLPEPDPEPVIPQPTPQEDPEPSPEPEPTPVEPEPTPVEPDPRPVEPEPVPVEPEPNMNAPIELVPAPEMLPVEPETRVRPQRAPSVRRSPAPVVLPESPRVPDRGVHVPLPSVEMAREGVGVLRPMADLPPRVVDSARVPAPAEQMYVQPRAPRWALRMAQPVTYELIEETREVPVTQELAYTGLSSGELGAIAGLSIGLGAGLVGFARREVKGR